MKKRTTIKTKRSLSSREQEGLVGVKGEKSMNLDKKIKASEKG